MNATQTESADTQDALYRVALSLESLVTNGILFGVLNAPAPGFLAERASDLMRELDGFEEVVPTTARPDAAEALAALRASAHRLVTLLTNLTAFRALSADQLRAAVSRVAPLREECVRLIQDLETRLRTRTPFYPSRSPHLTASVDAFLANLPQAFAEEWAVANPDGETDGSK